MRAQSPAGMRPPWRSRPSWFFRVQMTASTRWRSQFGNGRGCFSCLRAGRIRVSPGLSPAKNSSVLWPDRPLSVTTAVPGAGRFAGWRSRVCRAWSRSPCSLGFARLNPVTVPSQVQMISSLAPQYQPGMARAVPVAGVPEQAGVFRGDGGGAARDRGGVHQPRVLRGRRGGVGEPARGGLRQRRDLPEPGVVLALGQQRREQAPDLARGGAQPVPLAVAPEQDLRHGQAGELGVGDVRRPSRPAAAGLAQRDDPVGQFHVECGQEGVQVGGHGGLRGPDVWLARAQRPPLFAAGGGARGPAKPVSACSGRAGLMPATWRRDCRRGGQRSLPALSQAM
jgi:hypothetical protein